MRIPWFEYCGLRTPEARSSCAHYHVSSYFQRSLTRLLLPLPPAELPHNVLVIDMATFERSLYAAGAHGVISDPKTERLRTSSCTLNLEGLLRNLQQPQSHCTSVSANNSSSNLPSSTTPRSSPSVIFPQCSLVNSGNEAFMMLFAFQMLLDPLGTRIPTVRKGTLGSQTQGQLLAMANMDTIQAINMRRPLGMGVPGMLTQGISSMPMYGVSTMPMVVVDGVPWPIVTSTSPQLTQIPSNKSNSHKEKANSGSRKVQRAVSAFDLGGNSCQLQESVKRIYCSGPTRSSNSAPPLLAPVGQQQKGTEQDAAGTGIGSLWDRKPSPLGLGERHHRNSSLLRWNMKPPSGFRQPCSRLLAQTFLFSTLSPFAVDFGCISLLS